MVDGDAKQMSSINKMTLTEIKIKREWLLILFFISLISIISAVSYSNCEIYGNCIPMTTSTNTTYIINNYNNTYNNTYYNYSFYNSTYWNLSSNNLYPSSPNYNVSIGGTSAPMRLWLEGSEVNFGIGLNSTNANAITSINFYNSSGLQARFYYNPAVQKLTFQGESGKNIAFATSSSERLLIDSTGNSTFYKPVSVGYIGATGLGAFTHQFNVLGSSNLSGDLYVGNTSMFYVSGTSGNVSIGTASAGAKLFIQSSDAGNLIKVDANGDSGSSTSVGGALLIDNTGNVGAGQIIYSAQGASQDGVLLGIRANNPAFDQPAFVVDYTGNNNGANIVYKTNDTSGRSMDVISYNELDTSFAVAGITQGRAVMKVVHSQPSSDDSGSAGIAIELRGTSTASQGLYIDSIDAPTSGKLLNLRNNGIEYLTLWGDGRLGLESVTPKYKLEVNGNVSLNNTLFVKTSGNVGIGTTSPGSLLHLGSWQENANNYSWLKFDNTGSGYGDWEIRKTGSNDLSFGSSVGGGAVSDKLTILYGGNVGIGTTAPLSKLSVGFVGSTSYGISGNSPAGGVYGLGATYGVYGVCTGTTATYAGVRADGSAGAYDFYAGGAGTDYGTSSSIRWKDNVENITSALDKIMGIRGVDYEDNRFGNIKKIGFVAEEVGEFIPEVVVYEDSRNNSNVYTDNKGISKVYASGMDYSALNPVIVEAIKELKAENDALKSALCEIKPDLEVCK